MNAWKYYWYETGLFSQAVLKHVVYKFSFKKSVKGTGSVSCQVWHCSISKLFVMLHYFEKENFYTYGSQVGHIWNILWVSGSNRLTDATHLQPCVAWVFCSDHYTCAHGN